MKYLFLILLTVNSFAASVSISEMNAANREVFTSQSYCETKKGPCLDLPLNDPATPGVYKLADTYGGARKSVDDCSGKADCETKLAAKSCLSSQGAFIDEGYKFIYCMEKVGKEIQVDQNLLTQKQTTAAVAAQKEAYLQRALSAMDCGRRVKAVMVVQNASKNLSTAQVGQMVSANAPIMGLLDSGSLTTAGELILATPVDGVLITEADKAALLGELENCKPE